MDAGELEAALAELGALPKAGDAKLFVAGLMARCEDVDGATGFDAVDDCDCAARSACTSLR